MAENTYKEHGDMLKSELRATRVAEADKKKLALIEKQAIKKSIGRSPDRADALALAASYTEIKKKSPRICPTVFGRSV
jgi:Holliday junction resolvasome RuvABC endonuclease subunit